MKHSKLWILLFISLLTGCTGTKQPSVKVDPPSVTKSAPTSTIVVPSPTIHHTSTPTATVTPAIIPALSIDQSKDLFWELLNKNTACEFPCVFGITPGHSSKETLHNFGTTIGNHSTPEFTVFYREDDDVRRITWLIPQERYQLQAYFQDNIVEYLAFNACVSNVYNHCVFDNSIFNDNVEIFSLSQVMIDYGQPGEIFVWAWHSSDMPEPGAMWSQISLVLYYPEDGFLFEYIMPTESINNQYKGCLSKTRWQITTWDQENNPSLEELLEKAASGLGINHYYIEILKSTDEAFNMSEEEFFQTYQDPNNTCFFTPVDIWPNFD